ncbi:hypothetical protein [Lacunimicrobium album]
MLSLEHPQDPYTFAASHQLGMMKLRICQMSVEEWSSRKFTLEMLTPNIAALRWIQQHAFADQNELKIWIDRFEYELQQLVSKSDGIQPPSAENTHCTICQSELEYTERWYMGKRVKDRYCDQCTTPIWQVIQKLESCEVGFRIEAI